MTRVLIFNFFGGVMHRGIPLYAADIAESMRRAGVTPIELRCPKWLRRAPRILRNALFAVCEQIVAPLVRVVCRCSLTVYPYNSGGIVDALLGRSVLVVHDLLSNDRANRSWAARYIRWTQAVHRRYARPVCAASSLTLSQLRRLDAFKRCPLWLWSNPFYAFEAAIARCDGIPRRTSKTPLRILTCSGLGPNKDYLGALRLFAASRALRTAELHVIGFGHDAALARRLLARTPDAVAKRIVVHASLELDELVEQYLAADLVWIHSKGEGFGRCVIEARLAARPVVASDIGAFRRHKERGVYLYADEDFEAVVDQALRHNVSARAGIHAYHAPLEAAVAEVLAHMSPQSQDQLVGSRSHARSPVDRAH